MCEKRDRAIIPECLSPPQRPLCIVGKAGEEPSCYMQPHYSHSSCENAIPSSSTSLLASCKGVPPGGRLVMSLVLFNMSIVTVIQSFIVRQIVQLKTINTRRTPHCHFNENKICYFVVLFTVAPK